MLKTLRKTHLPFIHLQLLASASVWFVSEMRVCNNGIKFNLFRLIKRETAIIMFG